MHQLLFMSFHRVLPVSCGPSLHHLQVKAWGVSAPSALARTVIRAEVSPQRPGSNIILGVGSGVQEVRHHLSVPLFHLSPMMNEAPKKQ